MVTSLPNFTLRGSILENAFFWANHDFERRKSFISKYDENANI